MSLKHGRSLLVLRSLVPLCLFSPVAAVLGPLSFTTTAHAQGQHWIRQFGTSQRDYGIACASDGTDGVFLALALDGYEPSTGHKPFDVGLARYDLDGNRVWFVRFGTPQNDRPLEITPDKAGGFFVAGYTEGNLGGPNVGDSDCWIARYDSEGDRLWIRQFGTPKSDTGVSVIGDGDGGVYLAGRTEGNIAGPSAGFGDIFLTRYDSNGNQLWIRQIGGKSNDDVAGLAMDGLGGVFLVGKADDLTLPTPFSGEHFMIRYDAQGTPHAIVSLQGLEEWYHTVHALNADGFGGVFMCGGAFDELGGPSTPGSDVWVARYAADGTIVWFNEFGHYFGGESAFDLMLDGNGGVMIAGVSDDEFVIPSNYGPDALLVNLSSNGTITSIRQFGVEKGAEWATSIAPGGQGFAFVLGHTSGNLAAPNQGKYDVFLARFSIDYCPADCDYTTGLGVLDIFDFLCFQDSFIRGEPFACDFSVFSGRGVCDMNDFLAFQSDFLAGCP